MTDETSEEPQGSCICCHRRDPLPDLVPVCGPCRSRGRHQLLEIPEFVAELAAPPATPEGGRSEVLRYPPGHDHAGEPVPLTAELVPAAEVRGRSKAPRVAGSMERPVPISVDRYDLLAAARSSTSSTAELAYPEQDGDQVGYLSVATVLDGWCRDWADIRRESVPEPVPGVQCGWLLDRWEWACSHHDAVDEFAADLTELHSTLRRMAGRSEPRPELCVGVPCRSLDCDLKTLYRVPGSDYIECSSCGLLLTADEYRAWVRLLTAAARKTVVPSP